MFMKRWAAMLACLCILLGSIAAMTGCRKEGGETSDSVTQGTADGTQQIPPTEDPYADEVPADLRFDGTQIRIITNSQGQRSIALLEDDNQDEIVNAAVYERNLNVETRLGVGIRIVKSLSWDQGLQVTITDSLYTNSDDYDVIVGYGCVNISLAAEGLLRDLNTELPHIDLSKPYWGGQATENLSYLNKYYWATGDITHEYINNAYISLISKTVWNNMIAPSEKKTIYDVVRAQDWTIDTLKKYVQMSNVDLNGDQKIDLKDQFGLSCQIGHPVNGLIYSMGSSFGSRDGDGNIRIAVDSPRSVEIYSKLYDLLLETEGVNAHPANWEGDSGAFGCFTDNRTLVLFFNMNVVFNQTFRDMEPADAYAIVPMPKYDESQTEYITTLGNGVSIIGVPVTVPDDRCAAVGATLEVMSSEGYRVVYPAFYEKAMKYKYSRDDSSAEMLDLIRKNVVMDFVYMWSQAIGSPSIYDFFIGALRDGKQEISSKLAANIEQYQSSLRRDVLEKYEKNISGQ